MVVFSKGFEICTLLTLVIYYCGANWHKFIFAHIFLLLVKTRETTFIMIRSSKIVVTCCWSYYLIHYRCYDEVTVKCKVIEGNTTHSSKVVDIMKNNYWKHG